MNFFLLSLLKLPIIIYLSIFVLHTRLINIDDILRDAKYCTTAVQETLHCIYFKKHFPRLFFWFKEEKGKVFLKIKQEEKIYSLVDIFCKKRTVT